ncbi:MAG: transporter substrate-binding domain-containing protein [Rhizobacter sp.]|nr:transporter substrate-binding domain-containing protein [Bacteriovorax sp.]
MQKKFVHLFLVLFLHSTSAFSKDYKFVGQTYEPFNWEQNGKVKGGMVEVVISACLKMHVKCSFEILPMKRQMGMLEKGTVDGVLSLIKNSDRESYSTLSVTIIKSNICLHARKGTFSKIVNATELNGTLIGATSTSSAAKIAEQIKASGKNIYIEYEVGLETIIKKLSAGRYGDRGLGIANEDVAASFMKGEKIKNVTSVYVAETGHFGVLFSKKNVDEKFIEKFNKTVVLMKKSGEVAKLLKPYGLQIDL